MSSFGREESLGIALMGHTGTAPHAPPGTGLLLAALPLALGLDPAGLLLSRRVPSTVIFTVQAGPRSSTRIRPRFCRARADTR